MNFEKMSDECLAERKNVLETRVRDYEKEIVCIKSQIYCLYLQMLIRTLMTEIHKIDAEFAFREKNKKKD